MISKKNHLRVPFIHSFGFNIRFLVLNLGFFTASLLPSSVSSTLTFIRLQVIDGYSHAFMYVEFKSNF